MCGIDEAIRHIREDCNQFLWAEMVIDRLEYHRAQAVGVKPKYHKGQYMKDYYTCANCGRRIEIIDNFCAGCGFRALWDNIRCLTGLPLVDMAEKRQER
jgi:hypothetical protein